MIKLKISDKLRTDKKGIAYELVKGHIAVFIVPYYSDFDSNGRMYLLKEFNNEKVIIPSLNIREQFDATDDIADWRFLIVPLEESTLNEVSDSREIRKTFVEQCEIEDFEILGFEESCLEFYRFQLVKDASKTLSSDYGSKIIVDENKSFIDNLFSADSDVSVNIDNELYKTIKVICNYQNIDCPELKILRNACGENFTIDDIARIGGFVIRDITLQKDWINEDIGPIVGFRTDGTPVAILPKGGKYVYYDTKQNKTVVITKKFIENLSSNAVMLYRPFPNKSLELIDLVKFAIHDFSVYDALSVVLMIVLTTLIGLILPTLNQKIYDLFIPLGDIKGLFSLCLVLVACNIGSIAFTIVKSISGLRCFTRMKYALQAATIDRIFVINEGNIRKLESGDIASRTLSVSIIFDCVQNFLIMPLLTLIASIPYLIKMSKYSPSMTGLSLLVLVIFTAIITAMGFAKNKYDTKLIEVKNKMTSIMTQLISAISKIRIAGAEIRAEDRYLDKYFESLRLSSKSSSLQSISQILSAALPTVTTVIFYYLIVKEKNTGTLGNYMAFMSANSAFSSAFIGFSTGLLSFNLVIPYWNKLKELYQMPLDQNIEVTMPGELEGNIDVDAVTFGYEANKPIIKNLSMNIKKGEYVAIVGSSGCGKSTLLKLMLGFETPQNGKIYYDKKDLSTVDKRELRKQFGVVLQNGALISGSIKTNITVTKPDATNEEIEKVLKEVAFYDDVDNLPMGINTPLSEGAGGISGGQKQRILIARALISNPKVLFFDEATSALDNRTQDIVTRSINGLDCTRIIIAHRLSTIINCDRIFVMDQGKIVEEGNYQELIDKKGLFYRLSLRQTE